MYVCIHVCISSGIGTGDRSPKLIEGGIVPPRKKSCKRLFSLQLSLFKEKVCKSIIKSDPALLYPPNLLQLPTSPRNYAHVCISMYVYMYVYMHVCMHVCVYVCM